MNQRSAKTINVLVVGGAGFIGLNVLEQLWQQGIKAIGLGLNSPPQRFIETTNGQIPFIQGDLTDEPLVKRVLNAYAITHVLNCAAITAGPQRAYEQPSRIFDINVTGAMQLMHACVQTGVQRVIQLGSGSIFGPRSHYQANQIIIDKSHPVPETLYGISKLAIEQACIRYAQLSGMPIIVARIATCFGPWEHDTGVRDTLSIPFALCKMAMNGEQAKVYNRIPDDWLYSRDAAYALAELLVSQNLKSSIYQVGTGHRWNPEQFCKHLQELFPKFRYTVVGQKQSANVGVKAPSLRPPFAIDTIMQDTGYKPRFLQAAACRDYIAWLNAVDKKSV